MARPKLVTPAPREPVSKLVPPLAAPLVLPLVAPLTPAVSAPGGPRTEVATVAVAGTARCELRLGAAGQASPYTTPALLATHIGGVAVGQRVLAVEAGADGWLVVAAWPVPGEPPPLQFDAATGTLRIQAARLELAAIGTVELVCGDARLRLSLDGKVTLEGQEIVSSAIGAQRIEGGSIDFN